MKPLPPIKKLSVLEHNLSLLKGALVAFSGGCDSAFLSEAAHRALGPRSLMVTADSPSIPRRELQSAVALAASRGWRHRVVETRELEDGRYVANSADRCYFCKTALMDRVEPLAGELGWPVLLGTNTDDLSDHRPGQQAASERGALHPMVEAGLSKQEIRILSEHLGLPTHSKPAAACLASRFKYGVRVTAAGLNRIEIAEELVLGLGYRVVRVRDIGADRASVEIGPEQLQSALAKPEPIITSVLGAGFTSAKIDPRGYRSGSMNEGLQLVQIGRR